ncbi:MAG: hypothetical protein GYA46_07830 [candidate division Zixibacteria bacterium]|nr:hypothetical protein [candidate division Zixibacteria bacterium]
MTGPSNLPAILTKTTFIGLVVNVVIPTTLLVVMALVRGNLTDPGGIPWSESAGGGEQRLLFYILLAVAAVDLAVAGFLRFRTPASMLGSAGVPPAERFEKAAMNISWMIFSVNLSCTIYGLVLAILGLRIEVMMLFTALTLIGYQLFRPRQRFLEELWIRLEQDGSRRP